MARHIREGYGKRKREFDMPAVSWTAINKVLVKACSHG
jgi:hypothetical protein